MSSLAESIEQRLHSLPAPQARKLERLVLQLLERFTSEINQGENLKPAQQYTLPTRDLQVKPGLDLTKLAHFDSDGLDS